MEIPAAAGRRNRVEKDSATLREIDWNTRHGLPTVGRRASSVEAISPSLSAAGWRARFISGEFPLYFL